MQAGINVDPGSSFETLSNSKQINLLLIYLNFVEIIVPQPHIIKIETWHRIKGVFPKSIWPDFERARKIIACIISVLNIF